MTPEQVAEILLVQAAEETRPDAVPAEARIDALEAARDPADEKAGVARGAPVLPRGALAGAGALGDEKAWFARRAAFLLGGALAAQRPLLRLPEAFAPPLLLNVGLPALLGLSSNALGPHEHTHVFYTPIVLLVLWNLLTYTALAALALRKPSEPAAVPARASAAGFVVRA